MKTDAKIRNRKLASQIQQHIKKAHTSLSNGISCKDGSVSANHQHDTIHGQNEG